MPNLIHHCMTKYGKDKILLSLLSIILSIVSFAVIIGFGQLADQPVLLLSFIIPVVFLLVGFLTHKCDHYAWLLQWVFFINFSIFLYFILLFAHYVNVQSFFIILFIMAFYATHQLYVRIVQSLLVVLLFLASFIFEFWVQGLPFPFELTLYILGFISDFNIPISDTINYDSVLKIMGNTLTIFFTTMVIIWMYEILKDYLANTKTQEKKLKFKNILRKFGVCGLLLVFFAVYNGILNIVGALSYYAGNNNDIANIHLIFGLLFIICGLLTNIIPLWRNIVQWILIIFMSVFLLLNIKLAPHQNIQSYFLIVWFVAFFTRDDFKTRCQQSILLLAIFVASYIFEFWVLDAPISFAGLLVLFGVKGDANNIIELIYSGASIQVMTNGIILFVAILGVAILNDWIQYCKNKSPQQKN